MFRKIGISKTYFLLIFIFSFFINITFSEKDITISVAPKTEECFYEALKSGQTLDVDYQVIDGGQGALDISFYLLSPSGRTIIMDYKKPEKSHRIEINENGDYKICFDNTFSNFNSKTIYFELLIEDEDGTDVDTWKSINNAAFAEEQYEMTIQEIEQIVKRVKAHFLKIRHLQESIRLFAARDQNVLEANFLKVSSWSIIQILIMITVGFIQVLMVKSLFDDKSIIHKLWKNSFS